jgi:phage baseplate assembly protein W
MAALEVAIALPFRIDAQGNVATSTDQGAIWADRLKAAVGTIAGTRLMRSTYGSDLSQGFMDTTSAINAVIQDEVAKIFVNQFPTLTLISVSVDWSVDTNIVNAEVLYRLPSQDEAQTTVGIAILASDDLLKEANL